MNTETVLSVATNFLQARYDHARHRVASVAYWSGVFYYGLHLNSSGLDVCAEPVAIANALIAGSQSIELIVSVTAYQENPQDTLIIPPCGNCRQLLMDYCPTASVIVGQDNGNIVSMLAKDLLPWPYVKAARLGRAECLTNHLREAIRFSVP